MDLGPVQAIVRAPYCHEIHQKYNNDCYANILHQFGAILQYRDLRCIVPPTLYYTIAVPTITKLNNNSADQFPKNAAAIKFDLLLTD